MSLFGYFSISSLLSQHEKQLQPSVSSCFFVHQLKTIPFILQVIMIVAFITFSPPYYGKDGYTFPDSAVVIGTLIALVPISIAFIGIIVQLCTTTGTVPKVCVHASSLCIANRLCHGLEKMALTHLSSLMYFPWQIITLSSIHKISFVEHRQNP